MDYFNKEERDSQEKFRLFRDKFLDGFVDILIGLKLSPNVVSYIGVFFLALILIVPPSYFWLAGIFLALYVLMDGIDGPLARKLGRSHKGGSIVDMFADQLGIIIVPVAAILYLQVDGVVSLLFSVSYILLIVIVIFENELEDYAQKSFVRIKYPVYMLYIVSLYLYDGILLYWVFVVGAAYYWSLVFFRIHTLYLYFDNKNRS